MKKLRWLDAWRKPKAVVAINAPANDNKPKKFSSSKYQKWLEKKGFIKLGSGCFSTVYKHPKSNRVIKICHNPDAWIDYVYWAAQKGWAGKYAPKVYSFKRHHDFYVAVMEKMEYVLWRAGDESKHKVINDLWNYARHNNEHAKPLCEQLAPGLVRFGDELRERFPGKRFDLHGENIMIRQDGDFVVTDPVCHEIETKAVRLRAADFARAA